MSHPSDLQPQQPAPAESTSYGLAYFRVSTSDQANTSFDEDGYSIQAQREYCQRKAAEMSVVLVDEYVDRGKSARTTDRPALQAMLARIKEDTDIQYVFVHKLDRLARNRADDVQIGLLLAKSGVRLVSCTENIDDTPSGKLVHGIMADIAEWYSANLGEEAKKGMRKKVENGGTPFLAPLGYTNVRHKITELGKDVGVVQVHETYGPIITECFRRYDSGQYTIADVAEFANEQGLRMPAYKRLPERPVTASRIHQILHNRYYTGVVRYCGVSYPGDHTPLIDEATFERVQALLAARNANKRKGHQRPHHLKGTLHCGRCGRRLGITVAHNRRIGRAYPYFYCLGQQKDHNGCSQGYVAVADIEARVRLYLSRVQISPKRATALRQKILAQFEGKRAQGAAEIAKQQQQIVQLKQRQEKAKAAYFAAGLTLEEFKAEQDAIRQGIAAAEKIIAAWSVEAEGFMRGLDEALRLLQTVSNLYDVLPEGLKVLLITTVFEKIWIVDGHVVGGACTEPLQAILTEEAKAALEADGETVEYFRERERRPSPLPHEWEESWQRPLMGRDSFTCRKKQNAPELVGVAGSTCITLVPLARFKLNGSLGHYLDTHRELHKSKYVKRRHTTTKHKRLIKDRLNAEDVANIISQFKRGIPKYLLAQQYGIGVTSIKQLLKRYDVRRKNKHERLI